jgi:hypothetical protein
MRVDANLAKGMTVEEAAREARLRFGNPTVIKERVQTQDAALGLDSLWRWASGRIQRCFNCWTQCGCAVCPSRSRVSWPN